MARVLLAFLIDALVLAYPAYLAVQYRRLPPPPEPWPAWASGPG